MGESGERDLFSLNSGIDSGDDALLSDVCVIDWHEMRLRVCGMKSICDATDSGEDDADLRNWTHSGNAVENSGKGESGESRLNALMDATDSGDDALVSSIMAESGDMGL